MNDHESSQENPHLSNGSLRAILPVNLKTGIFSSSNRSKSSEKNEFHPQTSEHVLVDDFLPCAGLPRLKSFVVFPRNPPIWIGIRSFGRHSLSPAAAKPAELLGIAPPAGFDIPATHDEHAR